MAKSVFPTCDGRVVRVPINCADESAVVAKITVDNAELGFPVTGFALEFEGNYQFLHTVNQFVYAYIFGDRIGLLTLSGMSFLAPPCGPEASKSKDASLCSLFNKYKEKRLKKGKAIPINIHGCIATTGFLTGMRIELARPELPIVQYVMRFHVILQD